MTITFKTDANFDAFMNQAEGQWLNYRDDNQQPDFGIVDRLMDELNAAWKERVGTTGKEAGGYAGYFPLTLPLSLGTLEMAQSVLANCLEYTADGYAGDDDEPLIREGEVSING